VVKLTSEISATDQEVNSNIHQSRKGDLIFREQRKTSVLYSVFLALFLGGLLGIILINSSFFSIRSVVVQGNHTIPDETIILATRIGRNQNIFSVNRCRARQALLRNPYLAKAQLRLILPDRVVVSVLERHPECLIKQGNVCYLIGNDRTVLGVTTGAEPTDLPVVYGVRVKKFQIGKPITAKALKLALTILNNTGRELRPLLRQLDVAKYRLFLEYPGNPDRVIVELGNAERLPEKMANLRAVLAKNQTRNTIRIDLRVPEISTVTAAQK
jgi:cell division protein FtsQ